MYAIWSFEHDGWWGRGRRGYTRDPDEAGWYSAADAAAIVERANRVTVNAQAVPLEQILTFIPPPAILCPHCRRRSFHRPDIAARYCGACHRFHEEA